MGLLLKLVIRGVLVCVGMLLLCHDNHSAHAAQLPATDPFVDFQIENPAENCTEPNSSSGRGGPSRCLYSAPIRFKEHASGPVFSFSTKFLAFLELYGPFSWQDGYGGSATNGLEGFTFAVLPHPTTSRGRDGGYLGLLNATSNGDPQSHTFAVEFDFVNSPQFSDPEGGFHLGIDVNSMNSTAWAPLQGPSQNYPPWRLQVWINYHSSTQMLNVSTADVTTLDCSLSDEQRPAGPVMLRYNHTTLMPFNFLSQKIDLSGVLNEFMYVGFTSPLSDRYSGRINWISWSFSTSNATGPAAPSAPLPCHPYHVRYYPHYAFVYTMVSVLVSLSAMAVIYTALAYMYYSRWVERRGWRFNIDADDLGTADPHKFTYRELALATKNFDPKQALGRGGFGSVYKGFLPGNKQDVAVKRVAPDSNQGEREFMAEVMIIGKIRHRNLVRLQGWCHEKGELLLVYDLMPRGSLDKLLFASPHDPAMEELLSTSTKSEVGDTVELGAVGKTVVTGFPWERRFKVIVDVATALVYLHTECEERIIHRDVKAANVMLDAKFNARLGDFGLARSYNHSLLIPESTNVAGTFGYLAPELFHTGKQTEQTDVYSFGAFLLEVACGKKPIYHEDGEVVLLVEHVWTMWGNSTILATADPRLAGNYDAHEMSTVLCLGLLCSHPSPAMRPSMRQVLLILNGDVPLPDVPLSRPRVGNEFRRSLPHELSWTTNPSSYVSASATFRQEKQMNHSGHESAEDEESLVTSMTVIQCDQK